MSTTSSTATGTGQAQSSTTAATSHRCETFACSTPRPVRVHPSPAWVEDDEFERRSTLDLVPVDRFVLIAGERGEVWRNAAKVVADEFGVQIDGWCIGHAAGDLRDPRLRFERVREFGPEGVIVVRPDRCIAFRSMGAVDDPVAALRAVLTQVLARTT